ncbi:hypothetical protein QFW96_00070 [Saccharopolyspora sp. TS4A08]|uniref:IclR-ED domain-containing protein n=1 Tax=Saccharopolyspora ipomoeae TaxID=3042027 RepID=A0ABT6PGC9_9PSEU|nr:hypothetical protein [Saccharopolyspora sp. TS4A08]MDI2026977.1 hypothetical protein [Saccharopolyspora sp. TS4A08]
MVLGDVRLLQRCRSRTRRCPYAESVGGIVTPRLGRKLQAAVIAIGSAVENVHGDRCEPAELEVLARVCDEAARALREEGAQVEGVS